jgi:hypothetical protein
MVAARTWVMAAAVLAAAPACLAGCGAADGPGAASPRGSDDGGGSSPPGDASPASPDGAPGADAAPDSSPPPPAPLGLHTSGNRILDGNGAPVRLLGVNRSGTEYSCIHDAGFFDGPNDDASIAAMAAWKANAVRVPLNEDCWLGINGAPAAYAGAAYKKAVHDFVDRLLAHGLYPILELHWTAPGGKAATGQMPMPDRDHAPAFWTDVAAAYAPYGSVVLELFNEPYPDGNQDTIAAWTCWRDGGTCPGLAYTAAGMTELLAAVRAAGASNLVLLGGVEYSNQLSRWLDYAPVDPRSNIAAAWHVYDFNGCNSTACYDQTAGKVAQRFPIVATEIGEQDCAGGFITTLMAWLDAQSQSYLGWTWDTWGGCLVLVTDYAGTPNGAYGAAFKDHLAAVRP